MTSLATDPPLGVRRRAAVLLDDGVAVDVGVVHEELAAGLIARMEREPEQAALAAGRDLRMEVEERRRLEDPVPDQPDPASLLDHKQPAAVAGRLRDEDGLAQAAGDFDERQMDVAGDERGRRRGGTRVGRARGVGGERRRPCG
jgi:hypothetical protein